MPPTSTVTSIESTICTDPKSAAKALLQALSAGGAQAQAAVYALVNAVSACAWAAERLPSSGSADHSSSGLATGSWKRARNVPSCGVRPLYYVACCVLHILPLESLRPGKRPGMSCVSALRAQQDCTASSTGGSSGGGSSGGGSSGGGSTSGGTSGGGSSGGGSSAGGSSADPVDQTYKVRAGVLMAS